MASKLPSWCSKSLNDLILFREFQLNFLSQVENGTITAEKQSSVG